MKEKLTLSDVFAMIKHWLATPQNAYLGSSYGIDLKQYLHKPMSEFDGDAIIAKMRHDIPILSLIDSDKLNIYFERTDIDRLRFYIEINDTAMPFEIRA